ncbi:hypothetical protein L9F63_026440, partial [Diploptera punctata]
CKCNNNIKLDDLRIQVNHSVTFNIKLQICLSRTASSSAAAVFSTFKCCKSVHKYERFCRPHSRNV